MSSVSGSNGNSGNDDVTRKMRDDYRKKEAELIKKHQKELAAVDQKYTQEVSKLKGQNEDTVKDLRAKTGESLNYRDQRYQKEIDDLRTMHTKQMERLMSENAQKQEVQRDASRGEVKQANMGKSNREEELNKKFNEAVAQNEKKYNAQIETLREKQRESVDNIRSDLNEAHKKESEQSRDYNNEKIGDLKQDLQSTRVNANQRLRNQEIQHMNDKTRIESNNMDNLTRKEKTHNEMMEEMRDGYQDNVKTEQQKFADQMAKNSQLRTQFEEDFSNTVQDRMAGRENRLEREVIDAKNEAVKARVKADRDAGREVKSIRDGYQAKFEYLDQARKDTLTNANEINADNIKNIRAEADQVVSATNKQVMDKTDTEIFRYRQALDSTKQDFAVREKYKSDTADTRVMSVREKSLEDEKRLRENYEANLEVLKEGHESETKDVRFGLIKEKNDSMTSLKSEIQKKEGDHQRQMATLTGKYEKRIAELNDQFVREKRLRDNREKQLVSELKRGQDSQLEAVKLKYEEQNKATTAQHSKELQDVTRRQKDQIDNIMSISKKA